MRCESVLVLDFEAGLRGWKDQGFEDFVYVSGPQVGARLGPSRVLISPLTTYLRGLPTLQV